MDTDSTAILIESQWNLKGYAALQEQRHVERY